MRTGFKAVMIGSLATLLLGIVVVPRAAAQCASPQWNKTGALQPQSWQEPAPVRRASFVLTAGHEGADDRIVGFWKVKFVSEGNTGIGIPDGAVIDNGFVQWHGDGTEIMNSSRPPATGNFCLGVWEKSGSSSYELNHFALSFNPDGSFMGPAQIREQITLNRKADQYEGTFTIDQFDAEGHPLAHVTGRVTGKRVTVDTPVGEVL
jgi:hypothetical protein